MHSTPESGKRAGYDGGKKRKGTKVHRVVDTLGHLLTRMMTSAREQDRAQVYALCVQVQDVTGVSAGDGCRSGGTGQQAALDAANGGWS